MQRYLHPGDYSIQVRNEIANLLSENKENILQLAENARVSYMRGEFARRYDTAAIFKLMTEFDPAATYTPAVAPATGPYIYFKPAAAGPDAYKIYVPVVATAAGESPESHANKWQEYSARNPFVVLKLVDLILYDLHSKYARRVMPQTVIDRYNEAKEWITRVGDGRIDADLPVLSSEIAPENSDIRYGSHEVEDNRW
jgi:hypothetical protein